MAGRGEGINRGRELCCGRDGLQRSPPSWAQSAAIVYLAPAGQGTGDFHTDAPPLFVPAVVEAEPAPAEVPKPQRARQSRADGMIEVAIGGVTVRIGQGAEARTIMAVLKALKGGS